MVTASSADDLKRYASAESWDELAEALTSSREPGDVWLRTLAKNLSCIRVHRPALYSALMACDEWSDVVPTRSRDDEVVIALDEVDRFRRGGQAIAIIGSGDGALLRALSKFLFPLLLERQHAIDLIEPNLGRLIEMLGRVDLTGPRGAIEQPRIAWYVGPDWADTFAEQLCAAPTKMFPQCQLNPDGPCPEVVDALTAFGDQLRTKHAALADTIDAYYGSLDDAALLAALGPCPPRRPRVLLLTSLFTTVLRYSTADTADAFERLGWEARVLQEREPWHAMSKQAIRAAIADFKPDLFFQIDHLRNESADLIPDKLPFVCWIQDHLLNLASEEAAASIGERDFVLTGGVYRYVGRYGYPRRQCVDMPKVSREPTLPTSWQSDRDDLLYVSHWSQTPESIHAELCGRARQIGGVTTAETMRACADELMRVYAGGGSFCTELGVRRLTCDVVARRAERLSAEQERAFVDDLFLRLNNACYRQQALRWAGQIADELGLKLGIYGNGWGAHPQLGRYARGVVKYGPELEALTRESKLLLQIEPYACYTHQRMLDALLAGGFALVRSHPLNVLPVKVRRFLDAHVPPEVNGVDAARSWLTPEQNEAFDSLIAEAAVLTDVGDLVDVVRGWQRAGLLGDGDAALPHLDAITFDSRETLRDRVVRFVADEPARREIANDQRASVAGRLTYVAAIGRAMRVIHARLGESLAARSAEVPLAEAA